MVKSSIPYGKLPLRNKLVGVHKSAAVRWGQPVRGRLEQSNGQVSVMSS